MWYTKALFLPLLLTALLCQAVNSALAQSYYHSPNDTIVGTAAFNDVNVFNITQVHNSNDTLYFQWRKQSVAMPSGWEASICDNGNCYTSLIDSGMMIPIVPGDNGLMSLHLEPGQEPGTGVVRYLITESHTPQQVDTLTWIITAGNSTGIPGPEEESLVVVSGSKQIICRNPGGAFSEVWLYDTNGRLLRRQHLPKDGVSIPLAGYSASVLILRLSGKRNFIKKILNN